jgi:hypothetical protein
MANFTADAEQRIIDKLATHCRTIDGIRNAYGFAQNPDSIGTGVIPAVVFYPSEGTQDTKAHPNRWENVINITGLLFVAQRMSQGGTLKYLENAVLPFPGKFREKFQERAVMEDLLSLGAQRAVFGSWNYGAGGLLNWQGIDYTGLVLQWEFRGTN